MFKFLKRQKPEEVSKLASDCEDKTQEVAERITGIFKIVKNFEDTIVENDDDELPVKKLVKQ